MLAGYDSGMPMNPCSNCPYMMGGQYFPQQYMQTSGMGMYPQDTEREENEINEVDESDDMYRQPFFGHRPFFGPRPFFFPPFFRPRPFFFPPFFRPRPFFFPPFFPPFFFPFF